MPLEAALAGIRVLDFTRVLAGPTCTQLLADYGAEVLKLERPGTGDETREWGPPFVGGESAYYLCANRGKASLELDLSSAVDIERARALALRADILVENFRVGWMARHGLSYEVLCQDNPGLVYCSVTGYGQDGPGAELPGYDFLIQGQGGLMSVTGEADGPSLKVGVAIADLYAGLHATSAILAALHERARTGLGQYLDISLLDCQVAMLANVASNHLVSGTRPTRYGNAHPNIVPYAVFSAADAPIILAVGNDAQWCRCCEVLGCPEGATDPRFRTNAARVVHREAVHVLLEPLLVSQTRDHWLHAFRQAGVPAGPVQHVDEVFADAQVAARGMLLALDHPSAGRIAAAANPVLRSRTRPAPPPRLGEGGEALAARWLADSPSS